MELAPEDFVLHKFSWQPKAQTAAEAITELDLAPGAFMLLDDNPAECAMVTGAIPEITALDPAQPATWRMLEAWLVLPSARRTPEALRRTEMYREAAARRQALAGGQDYAKLMASLHMAADFRRARRGISTGWPNWSTAQASSTPRPGDGPAASSASCWHPPAAACTSPRSGTGSAIWVWSLP